MTLDLSHTPFGWATLLLVSSSLLYGCDSGSGSNASQKTIAQYEQHCAACHEVGAANAPRRGDAHQWGKRLKKGKDTLLSSVKSGLVAMPPMGTCTKCTDEDFRALIEYMSK